MNESLYCERLKMINNEHNGLQKSTHSLDILIRPATINERLKET